MASCLETAKSEFSSKTTDIIRVIPPDHPVHKQIYRPRDVPLAQGTADWLQTYLDAHTPPRGGALVVCNPRTGKQLSNKSLWEGEGRWKQARDKAGIPNTFHFHDLRKACLTIIGRQGATLAELQHFGGHSNAEAVMIYQVSEQSRLQTLVTQRALN